MVLDRIYGGRALRMAAGMMLLVLLMAGGAPSDMNISPQSDINNSFIMILTAMLATKALRCR